MTMRRTLVCLAALSASVQAWGQTRIPREHTIRSSTQSGQELRVSGYARWHRDCTADQPPQIIIRTPPAHGTVSVRPGPSTVSSLRPGSPDCTGKTYPGVAVWYAPATGFRGVDQFDWNVIGGEVAHDTAVVEVR